MKVASAKGKIGAREELILSGVVLLIATIAWFLLLYQPVKTRSDMLSMDMHNLDDSLKAIEEYKTQDQLLRVRIDQLNEEIDKWDDRFPPRSTIVSLTKQIIDFAQSFGLQLIAVEPSLFDMYALEKAGVQVSGTFIMQMPIKFHFRGRFLNTGKMLEMMEELPFNISLSEVEIVSIPDLYPLVESRISLYLYIHK